MGPFQTAVCAALPEDATDAALAARVWRPDVGGPAVAAIRDGAAFDISRAFSTLRDLCEVADPAAALRDAAGERIGALDALLANTPAEERAILADLAVGPGRPAGGESRWRDLRRVDAGARDRGTRPRRP